MQRLVPRASTAPTGPAAPRWLEPLPLGIVFSALLLVVIHAEPTLRTLVGGILMPLALLGLIAWMRHDDHVASAMLFSSIVTLSALTTLVVKQVIDDRSLGGAILFIMSGMVYFIIAFIVMFGAGYVGVHALRAFYAGPTRRTRS